MTFKNLKSAINDQQPLDEVVKELERLGYTKHKWQRFTNTVLVVTYKNQGWMSDYSMWVDDSDFALTTLAELKEM